LMEAVKLELPTSVLLAPSPSVDDASATRLRRAAVALLVLSLLTFHSIAGPAGVVASVGILVASSNGLVKSARCIRVTATITAVAAAASATFLAYAFVTDMPTRHVAAIEGQCNTIPSSTFEWGELVWEQHHYHRDGGWRPSDARPEPTPALAHHYHHLAHHDRSEGRSLREAPVETDTKVAAGSGMTVKVPAPPKTESVAARPKEHADKDDEDDEDEKDEKDDEDDEDDKDNADDDSEEAILASAEVAVDAAEAEGLYASDIRGAAKQDLGAEGDDSNDVDDNSERAILAAAEVAVDAAEAEGRDEALQFIPMSSGSSIFLGLLEHGRPDQSSTDDDVLNEDEAILQAADTAVEAFEAEMEELETFYLYGGDSDGEASQGAKQEEPADKRAQYCHMAAHLLARWGSAALAVSALSQLLLALSAAVVAKRAAQLLR